MSTTIPAERVYVTASATASTLDEAGRLAMERLAQAALEQGRTLENSVIERIENGFSSVTVLVYGYTRES